PTRVDVLVALAIVQGPLEPTAEQLAERLPLADAVEQPCREPDAVAVQIDGEQRVGGGRAVGVPAGPEHRGRGRVGDRRRMNEALRLADASRVRDQIADPAEAAQLDASPRLILARSRRAQGLEALASEPGEPRVEAMAGQAQGLAHAQLEPLDVLLAERGEQ